MNEWCGNRQNSIEWFINNLNGQSVAKNKIKEMTHAYNYTHAICCKMHRTFYTFGILWIFKCNRRMLFFFWSVFCWVTLGKKLIINASALTYWLSALCQFTTIFLFDKFVVFFLQMCRVRERENDDYNCDYSGGGIDDVDCDSSNNSEDRMTGRASISIYI